METTVQVTGLNPLALALLVALVYLIWALPRRWAICPLLIMTCLMPLGQELLIFGLNLHLFRVLLLAGVLRVMLRGEAAQLRAIPLDKVFIWWAIITLVCGTLAKPSMDRFINRAGDVYNALTCYLFVRCVIVELEDIVLSVRVLAWLSLPLAVLMMIEKSTAHNLLSVFGGVPAITVVRDGHLRCQGAFRHPILAGTFGATLIPLFVALWYCRSKYRRLAEAGVVASLLIVVAASSSGALMALFVGVAGLAFWKWRRYMRLLRWGTVLLILGLAVVMEAPVWYLLAKLGNVMGGTGWHRAWLIDQAVKHLDEWWLFGTTYTAHWGPAGLVTVADPDNMDITNHYVMEGVKGGLLKLGLFFAIVVTCFRRVGGWLRDQVPDHPDAYFVWGVGVSLFAHCLSFISITYFDQTIVIWYWLLAAIAALGLPQPESQPVPDPAWQEQGAGVTPPNELDLQTPRGVSE